jgi:hypothetical protein
MLRENDACNRMVNVIIRTTNNVIIAKMSHANRITMKDFREAIRRQPIPPDGKLPERLRLAIDRSGRSQREIAKSCDIAASVLCDIIAGRQTGRFHIHALAREIGVTVEWLESGAGDLETFGIVLDRSKRRTKKKKTRKPKPPTWSIRLHFHPRELIQLYALMRVTKSSDGLPNLEASQKVQSWILPKIKAALPDPEQIYRSLKAWEKQAGLDKELSDKLPHFEDLMLCNIPGVQQEIDNLLFEGSPQTESKADDQL